MSTRNESPWGVVRVDLSKAPEAKLLLWGWHNKKGASPIAGEAEVVYSDQESLPEWLKRKLAVLMGFDHESINEAVPNVGRRVSKYVYWVFRSLGEELEKDKPIANTRKKSKAPRPKDA